MAASLITVVDDDASVRESISSLLRSLGHAIHEFGSAEAFLASAAIDATAVMTSSAAPAYVVHDDPSVRESVGSLIRSAGWSVEAEARCAVLDHLSHE
jgi:FixJ family two-component response regulator